MKLSFRRIALTILVIYVLISCYTAYVLVVKRLKDVFKSKVSQEDIPAVGKEEDDSWNPWGLELEQQKDDQLNIHQPIDWQKDFGMRGIQEQAYEQTGVKVVEIWGKAAIGIYLWEHIFGGTTLARMGGVWSYGTQQFGNILFRYRTGPGVVPAKVPQDVENLVLVLNGREQSKVDFARMWLDYLPNFKSLRNVAVVMLGNEQCDNDWIKEYMAPRGGLVKFVFLVYDSPDIDEKYFFQWPLGVATYRRFPVVNSSSLHLKDFRRFQCNFLGTVYANSSREELLRVVRDFSLTQTCYINPRLTWQPSESGSSLDEYQRALVSSDLTLSPVGFNPECYRIYEAMAYGSIPVIEDREMKSRCGTGSNTGELKPTYYRLLKQYGAPVIFVRDWKELPQLLIKDKKLNIDDLVRRRRELVRWYAGFRLKMRDKLIGVVREKFFSDSGDR